MEHQLTLISQRARSKCDYCNQGAMVWYRDENGRKVMFESETGQVHVCSSTPFRMAEQRRTEYGSVYVDYRADREAMFGKEDDTPSAPVSTPSTPSAPVQTPESADLIRVLRDAIGASVNEDQVRRIVDESYGEKVSELRDLVRDELAKLSMPTMVEVLDRKTFDSKDLGIAHKVFPQVFRAIQCGVHVWLVGPAGTGKTHIGHQCATGLGLDFGSISLTVTMPVSSIIGYMDANGTYRGTSFRRIWEHGGVFLFDEGDAGNANTWGVINEALSNGSMEFPDGRIDKHPNTYILCAANTYGTGADRQYVGRMQLDAATLDRFVHIEVPVDEAMESALGRSQGASQDDMDWLIPLVRQIRQGAQSLNLKVVISPRAILFGARLLAGGFTRDEVVSMAIRKGISDQDWGRINA